MLIMAFVKKNLKECFEDIETTSVGAGILGLMGNKGATGIRLSFHPKHHLGKTHRPDRPDICEFALGRIRRDGRPEKCRLPRLIVEVAVSSASTPTTEGSTESSPYVDVSVFDTDVLFWMGGLWTTPPRRYYVLS